MQQKHNLFRLNRYTISTLVLLVVLIAAGGIVVTRRSRTDAAAAVKPRAAAVKSQFSFTGTPGWWQGATNGTTMALFPNAEDCFVSIQHKTGTIAADEAKLQRTDASLVSDGYTITPGSTQMLTIQTPAGSQQYQLQQSSVTTPSGADKVEGGQEFGHLQLSDGYLFIEGYCDTPDEVPTTIPALQAIKFDEAK